MWGWRERERESEQLTLLAGSEELSWSESTAPTAVVL